MPDQERIHDPAEQTRQTERDILYALTDPEDNQPLWSLDDLAREMGEPMVVDYVNSLHRSGLVHRTSDGYIFATRSAVRQIQIIGRVA
jgi:Mn-dependent DtxR family transcriptional regulator